MFFFSLAAITLYALLAMAPEGFFESVNRLNAVITAGLIFRARVGNGQVRAGHAGSGE